MRRVAMLITGLILAAAASAQETPSTEDRLRELEQQLAQLKKEKEVSDAAAEAAASAIKADPATVEALTRAEIAKALAVAQKATDEAQLEKDFGFYEKLKGISLKDAGVAGDFLGTNDLPASLRSKFEAEASLNRAIGALCAQVTDALTTDTTYVDKDGTLFQSAADSILVRKQMDELTAELKRRADEGQGGPPMSIAPSGLLAAIQGVRILSEFTRLFRTDTKLEADSHAFDATEVVVPLVEQHCSAKRLDPMQLAATKALDDPLKSLLEEERSLRAQLARAQQVLESQTAKLAAAAKDKTSKDVAQRPDKVATLKALVEQADAFLKSLTPQAMIDAAYGVHVGSLLTKDARLLRVTTAGEARRMLRKGAFSSAKATAAGSAYARLTVRDGKGNLKATQAVLVDSDAVPITKISAGQYSIPRPPKPEPQASSGASCEPLALPPATKATLREVVPSAGPRPAAPAVFEPGFPPGLPQRIE